MQSAGFDQDSSEEADNDLPVTPPDDSEATTHFEVFTPYNTLETLDFNLATLSPEAVTSDETSGRTFVVAAQSLSLEDYQPTITVLV
jgi:hypothetical protein